MPPPVTKLQPLKGHGISWRSTEVEFREVVEEAEPLQLEGPPPEPEPEVVHLGWAYDPAPEPIRLDTRSEEGRDAPGWYVRSGLSRCAWYEKIGIGWAVFSAGFLLLCLMTWLLHPPHSPL